jgi:hypothetical protein
MQYGWAGINASMCMHAVLQATTLMATWPSWAGAMWSCQQLRWATWRSCQRYTHSSMQQTAAHSITAAGLVMCCAAASQQCSVRKGRRHACTRAGGTSQQAWTVVAGLLCAEQGTPVVSSPRLSLPALQILAHVPPMQRERVAQVLQAPGYLRKLLDLFRVSSSTAAAAAAQCKGA